jgi:hypothetical protein
LFAIVSERIEIKRIFRYDPLIIIRARSPDFVGKRVNGVGMHVGKMS